MNRVIGILKYPFIPLMATLRDYTPHKARLDFVAGLTVTLLVLPQSLAYAHIAGLPPVNGLYAALVPVAVGALLASFRFLHTGPTNATALLVASAFLHLGALPDEQKVAALGILVFLTGIIQVAFALARTGRLTYFVSYPVVLGFTIGAATLIGFNQVKDFLGIEIGPATTFLQRQVATFKHLGGMNLPTVVVGTVTLAIILAIRKFRPSWPGPILAVISAAVAVSTLDLAGRGVALIGSVPPGLPRVTLPAMDLNLLSVLSTPALAIALMAFMEATAITRAITSQTGERVDTNRQFFAQGMANVVGSFFGAMPAGGSFTRTALLYRTGAQTLMSSVFSAMLVLLTLLLFAPMARFIPTAALAALLISIAASLIDPREIARVYRTSREDAAVMVVTFLAVIFLKLEFAVLIGVVMSLGVLLGKISTPELRELVPVQGGRLSPLNDPDDPICPQIAIYQMGGQMFFAAAENLEDRLVQIARAGQTILILRMGGISHIDATGVYKLAGILGKAKRFGGTIILTGLSETLLKPIRRSGLLEKIGTENLAYHTGDAIRKAIDRLDYSICRGCTVRAFSECNSDPRLLPPPRDVEGGRGSGTRGLAELSVRPPNSKEGTS